MEVFRRLGIEKQFVEIIAQLPSLFWGEIELQNPYALFSISVEHPHKYKPLGNSTNFMYCLADL
jgi:hypothetical protein